MAETQGHSSIRPDLDEYLGGVEIGDIIAFDVVVGDEPGFAEIVSGGFGYEHVVVRVGEIELGLIECDGESYDGPQDGSDDLQATGWAWREYDADETMMGAGWSEHQDHATAAEALAAARAAIAKARP